MSKPALLHWLTAPSEHALVQVPRALAASGAAAALDMGVLVLLVSGAGWHPLPAATVSYLLGVVLQYLLCALWGFPAGPPSAPLGFTGFAVLSLVGLGITWLTLGLLHDLAHVNYALAKVVALGFAFTWNFLSRKYLIFKLAA
jgi:putative flippase GtrA